METESGLWHRAIQTVVRTESPLYNFQTEEASITEAELSQLAEEVDREFNDVPAALKAVHRVVADVEKEILADLMNEMIKEMAVMQAKKKTDADKDCAQNIS
jgi:chromosomal replication initiation ATPase DnaA